MNKKEAELAIDEMKGQNGGKLFIGMVHQIYGPLRGLNFIIKDLPSNEAIAMMDEAQKPVSSERELELMMKRINSGIAPSTMRDLAGAIWSKTMLATIPMILPFEMVAEAENPPAEVSTLKDGIKAVYRALKLTEQLQKSDLYFFRKGII